VISKVILSVNVEDSFASKVMLMHHRTVRYSIYGVVQEKSVSYGLESTVYGIRVRWEDGNERYVQEHFEGNPQSR